MARALEINPEATKERLAQEAYASEPRYERYCYEPEAEPIAQAIYTALVTERPALEPEPIARVIHKVLREKCTEYGMNPDIETFISSPKQTKEAGYGDHWRVSWESGPFEWAIGASWAVIGATGRLCEPHYSFDLCLYKEE